MTELELRNKVVEVMRGWLGWSEANGKYRAIIDLYNTQEPLPRGYPVQYDDEWCATCVTAAGIQARLQDIIFGECGCGKMIELYRAAGRWEENDAYRPEPGDIIMYDWQDTGKGDNTGGADHVGIVEKVVGNTITIIEGNSSPADAGREWPIYPWVLPPRLCKQGRGGRHGSGEIQPDVPGGYDGLPEGAPGQ